MDVKWSAVSYRPFSWTMSLSEAGQFKAFHKVCSRAPDFSTVSSMASIDPNAFDRCVLSGVKQDSSKVVREAAIELLGRHIGADGSTAAEYFDHFVSATRDSGVGVRKRALQILWDSCIRCACSHSFSLCHRQHETLSNLRISTQSSKRVCDPCIRCACNHPA